MNVASASAHTCSACDIRLSLKARSETLSTSSSHSSAAVRSGSDSSSQGEQNWESLGRVDSADLQQQVSYIPVFGFKPSHQQSQQLQAARHDGEADCQVSGVSEDATVADSDQKKDAVQRNLADLYQLSASGLQQHSLQLALEHSSSGWLQQTPDTFVPLLGVPPAWLCGHASSSVDLWPNSRLSELPQPPPHVPKLCVTVSRVSSELDSLAILPLTKPALCSRGDAGSPGLSGSRHLGEF